MSFFTEEVYERPQYQIKNPMAVLTGKDCFDEPMHIPLTDMHLMVLGAPGMGKTVQITKIMSQTMQNPDSIHVVFDPKGDYYRKFYREGQDYVLSLFDIPGIQRKFRWKLMNDVAIDDHPETAILEITKAIGKEEVEKNTSNPFFPLGAESLMAAIWTLIYRRYQNANDLPNNRDLIEETRNLTREQLLNEATQKNYTDILPVFQELIDPKGGVATKNLRQEMEGLLTQAFNPDGNFCSEGDFSIRDFIRNGKGKRLFLVYNPASAESSRLIYGVLINLMMKEAISLQQYNSLDRTYFYLDELPMLPDNLTHMTSLCTFGRSMGNRVIIGIQGLSQLYHTYGEDNGNAILSAFTDNIIMKANDPITIEKISERSGQVTKVVTRTGITREVNTSSEQTHHIPKEIMASLDVGEAVISVRGAKPFYIYLDQ